MQGLDKSIQVEFSMLIEAVDPKDCVLLVFRHQHCEIFASFNVIGLHNFIQLISFSISSNSKRMTVYPIPCQHPFLVSFNWQVGMVAQLQNMRVGESKRGRFSHNGPSISNLVQLKLMESEHAPANRHTKHQSIANAPPYTHTPSTNNGSRNFHSCRLEERPRESTKPIAHLRLLGKERGCASTTKIMTLQQIKLEEEKVKMKEGIRQSPSRKIFVSISRQNSRSLQRKKQLMEKREDPEIKPNECLLYEQKQTRPGIKLNIYKEMARKNTGSINQ